MPSSLDRFALSQPENYFRPTRSSSQSRIVSGSAPLRRSQAALRLETLTPQAGKAQQTTVPADKKQRASSSKPNKSQPVTKAQPHTLSARERASQQKLLSPVDRQAAQQQEERRNSHSRASSSDGRSASEAAASPTLPTELIFRLDRRGVGWGEEILPHLTVEQRVLKRNRSAQPDPWTVRSPDAPPKITPIPATARSKIHMTTQRSSFRPQAGSAELYLRDVCGIPEHLVDAVLITAVAWRVTPGGRPLIDRRRRCRCERNMPLVARYLQDYCGVPQGREGVGAIFLHAPQLMLCKPIASDRWDRRAVELAAFWLVQGHTSVPEDYNRFPDLGPWVRRQRMVQQQGTLSEQRLLILAAIGFDFGDEAQITDEWELKFDHMVDWILWKEGRVGGALDWVGLEWDPQGGLRAREVVLWAQLQREFRRRCLLPELAMKRLEAVGFCWDPQKGTAADVRWMTELGGLLYVMERQKNVLQKRAQADMWLKQRLTRQSGEAADSSTTARAESDTPDAFPPLTQAAAKDLMVWVSDSPVMLQKDFGIWATHTEDDLAWLQKEVPQRSAAIASASLEPGQATWLAHQRWLWRHNRLAPERMRLLRLVGVDFVMESADHWRDLAHEAAYFMHGCRIGQDLEELEAASIACMQDGTDKSSSHLDPQDYPTIPRSKTSRLYPELVLPPEAFDKPKYNEDDDYDLQRLQQFITVPNAASRSPPRSLLNDESSVDESALLKLAVQRQRQYGTLSFYSLPVRKPGRRLAVLRWVLNARALWREDRLSEVRFRYMTMLGLAWVLRDEAFTMSNTAWGHCLLLLARPPMEPLDEPLREWLSQQRALGALGQLPVQRAELLSTFVADWLAPPSKQQQEWEVALTQLLAFRRTHRHTRVPEAWPPAPLLHRWLLSQREHWRSGRLPALQSAQLQAIGVDFIGT